MANRYISLPDELNKRLKQEENASELIQRLLFSYYNLVQSPQDKLEEIKKEIEIKEQQATSLQLKVNEMERKKEQIINERIKEEEVKEVSEERRLKLRALHKEAFFTYEINRDDVELLLDEYYSLLNKHQISSIIEYMQLKNINKRILNKSKVL
jgi:hypothetical protein